MWHIDKMRGVVILEPKIINYIEISGEDVLFDTLTDDEKKAFAEMVQERAMAIAGYKRKTA